MLWKMMAANCGSGFLKISDFYYIYSHLFFFILDLAFDKIAFHEFSLSKESKSESGFHRLCF